MIYEHNELGIGMGAFKGGQRLGKVPVAPFQVCPASGSMETAPQSVADFVIIPCDGPHVGKLVSQRDNLRLEWSGSDPFNGGVFPDKPTLMFITSRDRFVAFNLNQAGNPFPELPTEFFQGDIGILYHVVKRGGGKQFLVGSHRSHYGDRFKGMDYIWESLPAAFSVVMRPYRENYRPVKNAAVNISVRHGYIS